ncbi:MAG: YbaB/EbfC family nucleoid-associated protein [Spirochaetaceae bacterium]|jgi:DNA-binding YbaB/EbfC family protein|nr:YbaB/EbfC family nucleoid-associated protein [Spirochaetaceae bacterium]
MDINPFDILKNARMIQEQMGSIQEKLAALVVTGSSGGGMVEIDLNGKFEMTGIRIAGEALEPLDISLLQDLVKAAHAGAAEKIREALSREMGALAGGIPSL